MKQYDVFGSGGGYLVARTELLDGFVKLSFGPWYANRRSAIRVAGRLRECDGLWDELVRTGADGAKKGHGNETIRRI